MIIKDKFYVYTYMYMCIRIGEMLILKNTREKITSIV